MWGRKSPVGSGGEVPVEGLGGSPAEAEAVSKHCLQIQTAQTIKIGWFSHILWIPDSWRVCFMVKGQAIFSPQARSWRCHRAETLIFLKIVKKLWGSVHFAQGDEHNAFSSRNMYSMYSVAHNKPDYLTTLGLHVPEFLEPENWPPNSPDLNTVDYLIWGALQQPVYRRRHIWNVEHMKEVPQTCWEQIGQRHYRLCYTCYRTVLQTIVTTGRTHWAPLWLMFLVLHVHYHTYAFLFKNTELGQQK